MPVSEEPIAGAMTFERPHAQLMDKLKRRLQRICDALPTETPVVYIDYPLHGNVGDLMIHAGADAFLRDCGYEIVGRFSLHDLSSAGKDELRRRIRRIDERVGKGASIVLHGGGNVGDIWPRHQALREALIRRYPGARIVIFPQSVHFNDRSARARSAEVLRRHRGIVFFVRDEESLEFAGKECGCPAEALPDMAHHLWRSGPPGVRATVKAGTLVQRRRDKERAEGAPPGTFDWDDLRGLRDRVAQKVLVRWSRVDRPFEDAMSTWRLWYKARDRLIRRAFERFGPYKTIDTDRLHGVILGALLEKQIVVRDNCYGKLNRYCSLWLADSDRIAPPGATRRPGADRVAQGQIMSTLSQRSQQVTDPSEFHLL